MAKYGIQNSFLSNIIDVGRLNKDQTMFVDREDHTDAAIHAVVDHVGTRYDGKLSGVIGTWRFEITATKQEEGEVS